MKRREYSPGYITELQKNAKQINITKGKKILDVLLYLCHLVNNKKRCITINSITKNNLHVKVCSDSVIPYISKRGDSIAIIV